MQTRQRISILTGCSRHITGGKSLFNSPEDFGDVMIPFKNGSMLCVLGWGTICAPRLLKA